MKKIIAIALIAASPALAAEPACKDICSLTALDIRDSDPTFPQLASKPNELITWRASRCGKPPVGKGNVVRLCEATTTTGMSIFYWVKNDNGRTVAGFHECP